MANILLAGGSLRFWTGGIQVRKIRKNKPPIEAITQILIYGERFNAVVCPYCLHTLCLEKDAGKRNINSCPECGQKISPPQTDWNGGQKK